MTSFDHKSPLSAPERPQQTTGWIGARLSRREDVRLLTGRGRYLGDLQLPGMLEMAILRSSHAAARIARLETAAAAAQPGVALVLTGADLRTATRPFRLKHRNQGMRRFEWYALATAAVNHVGHAVAAVVADDRYAAEDALEQIGVDYERLPAVASVPAALAPGAPRVHSDWPDNLHFQHEIDSGDVDGAFQAADVVIDRSFTIQRHAGHPMECRGCVAQYDGERLTVWTMSQWPYVLRSILAECLGLPENRIRVIAPEVGGAFGVKMHIYGEDVLVALAAMRLGRPVRWLEDRREHFVASVHAREQHNRVQLAATRDGRLLGLRVEINADVGTGMILQPSIGPATNTALTVPGPYRLPAYHAEIRWVATHKTPAGAYRGYGVPQAAFMMERLMDMLADATGLDPAEVRRRNLLRPEELPCTSPAGCNIDNGDYPETLEKALAAFDYEAMRERQVEARRQGRHLGIGIACYLKGTVSDPRSSMGAWGSYESAAVRMDLDGSVTVYSGLADQGQGHRTMLSQVVADVLGLHPSAVQVQLGETGTLGYGLGAWGSRGAAMGGGTALKAAEALRDRLRAVAAVMLGCHPEDLFWNGRGFVRSGGGDAVAPEQAAAFCYNESFRLPPALKPPLEAVHTTDASVLTQHPAGRGRINKWLTYTGGVHLVLAEVDPATGQVRLGRYVAVHDAGRVINPLIVEGQEVGGIAQGMGGALFEDLIYDDQGQLLTGSYMDYLLPSAAEMPPAVAMVHVEHRSPSIPGGFKGAGEGSVVGAYAAISNAVADALAPFAVEVTATPLSPARIRALIRASDT